MIDPVGLLQAFLIFLAFAAVCAAISFFFAYDPERHGGPWHERVREVVLDCDGVPFDEYKKTRDAADAKRAEQKRQRTRQALADAKAEVERLAAEVAKLQENP